MRKQLLHYLFLLLFVGWTPMLWAQQDPVDELERLVASLNRLGPDAADERQGAVESLLQRLDLLAHERLQEKLMAPEDRDNLRRDILTSLARRLNPNNNDRVFGPGDENREARNAILRSYVPALAWFWRDPTTDPLRELARSCLVRLPMRELEAGLRLMLDPARPLPDRLSALRVAVDSQNLYLARLLADFMDAPDDQVRAAARDGLVLLTFVDGGFARRQQFEDWYQLQLNNNRRYLDLAETAARNARASLVQLRKDMEARLRQSKVDLVAALVTRSSDVDWAKVQAEVLSDDPPGSTDACLKRLLLIQDFYDTKAPTLAPRQAFHKALFERFQATEASQPGRRALLLETLALLVRPGDSDLGGEVSKALLEALSAPARELRLAALRGLREHPRPDVRTAVVKLAIADLEKSPLDLEVLREALRTLGRRPWTAPAAGDADKALWLHLLSTVILQPGCDDLRADALAMGQLADPSGSLLPEVFDILLEVGRDPKQPVDLRRLCLIQLKDFVHVPDRANRMVRELCQQLEDPDSSIRTYAATELGRLPETNETQKQQWLQLVLEALRRRMTEETDAGVFDRLAISASACAAAPGSPSEVISSLLQVFELLREPVPADKQFKLDPLLRELAALACSPQAPTGVWTKACDPLLRFTKRRALRSVLEQQHASNLTGDLASPDKARADAARRGLYIVLQTALLKPVDKTWLELKNEADDVRSAFQALESAGEDLDASRLRILRMEVLVGTGEQVSGNWTEAVKHAEDYLSPTDQPKNAAPLDDQQKDTIRLLEADAHLHLDHRNEAAARIDQCDPMRQRSLYAMALMERLGKAFADSAAEGDAQKAALWLERVAQWTTDDDKLFRPRLLAWANAALKASPSSRELVQKRLLEKEALFMAAECPPELRDAFEKLR